VRVGVFTPLLSQLSLEDVLKKLKSNNIDTVELGTGNYPGDAHCKLSMLDNNSELIDFEKKLGIQTKVQLPPPLSTNSSTALISWLGPKSFSSKG